MNFLEYGMKYKNGKCRLRRWAARILLAAEKKRADFLEAYIDRKQPPLPDDPEGDAALLQKIWAQIREEPFRENPDSHPDKSDQGC